MTAPILPHDVVTRDGRRCQLREQREGDAAAVVALDARPNHSVLEEQVAVTALAGEGGLGLVAEAVGEGIIGHLVVSGPRRPDGGGELAIFVHNSWRNAGLGRCMLEAAVEWGRASDLEVLRIRVAAANTAARTLYEHLGFVPSGGDPASELIMEFRL